MRTIRFTLFVLCMFMSNMAHAYDFSAVNSDGVTIYYNIIGGQCEVTNGDVEYSGVVNIPSTVSNQPVTSIGDSAFEACSDLTSITIPNSVTGIGEHAFGGCFGLTSITIPNSVTSIGDSAFEACSDLTSITIPNSVTSIGEWAFSCCSRLTSITIPNSVTSIGDWAFLGCSSLTSIVVAKDNENYDSRDNCNAIIEKSTNTLIAGCKNTVIPNSVTNIGNCAFEGCSGLTSITIPNSVTGIGEHAFSGCSGLTSITIPNSVTSIGEAAFSGCSDLTSITIPNSVTSIGKWAFLGCSGLTSITIPNSVTSIGLRAFCGCSGLTSITIPNSVTSIGYEVLMSCSSLTSIIVSEQNEIYDSRDNCNAVIEKSSNTLIAGCKNTIIPNSVTSIGNDAFLGCSGLTSITIPNSVTNIGNYAFQGCSGLTSITIPNSVTNIGNYAFYGCSGIENVYNYALYPQSISSKTFTKYGTLHVKRGCKNAYENAEYWNLFTIVDDIVGDIIPTDISKYANIIYFNPTTARPGTKLTMPLMMNNVAEITALQFNVELPDGVSIDTNSKGKYALRFNPDAERTDASCHTLSSKLQDDGSVLVLCYSVENELFAGNSGAVIDFPVTLSDDIAADAYPVRIKNVVMTKSNKEEVKIDEVVCLLDVPDYKMGDVNSDDIINVTDIVYTADHILGNKDANFNVKAADMNEDAIINVTDIVYIADMILSGTANGAKAQSAKGMGRASDESTLSIMPFNITAGAKKTVTLDMTNPGREITAFQFDMYLPDGLAIDKKKNGKFNLTFNIDTERTDASCHTLAASLQDSGAITFLCYSVDKDAFADEQGAVVDIPLTASATMPDGEYEIRLENILLTCTDKSEIKPANVTIKVTVGNTTSISGLSEQNGADEFYNVNGMRQSTMHNSINIVRMGDGTVKKVAK